MNEDIKAWLAAEPPAERAAREALWWAMFHWKGSKEPADSTLAHFIAYRQAVIDAHRVSEESGREHHRVGG